MSRLPFDDRELIEADQGRRSEVLNRLLERHRDRLLRMVQARLHPQIRARVDASDVVQEACLEIAERVEDYVADPRLPFFLWARRIAGDRLLKAHRFHLDAKQRDVRRQVAAGGAMPDVSTVALVDQLAGARTSPSVGAARAELRERIAAVLDELGDIDREVLCMRHWEELTNEEVAQELGLSKHAQALHPCPPKTGAVDRSETPRRVSEPSVGHIRRRRDQQSHSRNLLPRASTLAQPDTCDTAYIPAPYLSIQSSEA